jgi:hypothetical protein
MEATRLLGYHIFTFEVWLYLRMSTQDREGLLGESGGLSVRKGEESVVESWHFQGYSPHLHRLRTEGLVPVSKY